MLCTDPQPAKDGHTCAHTATCKQAGRVTEPQLQPDPQRLHCSFIALHPAPAVRVSQQCRHALRDQFCRSGSPWGNMGVLQSPLGTGKEFRQSQTGGVHQKKLRTKFSLSCRAKLHPTAVTAGPGRRQSPEGAQGRS